MRNRKGFEKPIEIFVALFIILAVALVLLKLFQNQISEKQKELADVQQEQEAKERMDKFILACAEKCTQASNNQCSSASLASLCATSLSSVLGPDSYIDLNNNQIKDYDTTYLAGIGVCEDRMYCFHVMDNCCNTEISATNCKTILTKYWTDNGLVATLPAVVPPGTCTSNGNRWDELVGWT